MARARGRDGVVAANLKKLIGEDSVNGWAIAHKLDQPTIRRILIGETSPTELMIAKIAERLGLDAWQLLVPDVNPKSPPVLREVNDSERKLYERIDAALKELGQLRELASHKA